jgi:hypothetical protein
VDTGADENLIKDNFLLQNKKHLRDKKIFLGNRKPFNTPHAATACFNITTEIYRESLIVCDDILHDMILLFKWCKKHDILFESLPTRVKVI